MIQITNTVQVQASPEKVWDFLGDLSSAPDYVPGVVSVSVDGLMRYCTDQDGNEIHEQISNYSDETRSFSFEHVKSPMPVQSSRGRFDVTAEGDQSAVSMIWDVELLDPAMNSEMKPMLEQASEMTLNNIKENFEAG